ncbi:HNH endonuclease [Sutcliffiella horikoshii]|uniref:HNH endonuclease n=1 Tax=Sutcliffiella horikoshii TaxID=79883 RepID=UPI0032E7FDA5
MERDNHLCQRCIKQSKLQAAQLVHHIVEVKVDWSKRLELTNLESICHSCHNKHHKS